MSTPLSAVILAGGASRRMGRDKATMAHPGRPEITMVEHTAAVLGGRCGPVFVVAAPGQRLPDLPATILHDERPGQGPLAATARGLHAAADAGADRAFVAAVDMPYLSVGLVELLVDCPEAGIALPWDGRDHYLAGVYRTSLAGVIDTLVLGGERSMRALVDAVPIRRVPVADPVVLTNLNEPHQLH